MKLVSPEAISDEVLCISSTGMKLVLPVHVDAGDFVYGGRLFVLNHDVSAKENRKVFTEVNAVHCKSMREQAAMVNQMCARWEAQLEALKEPTKQ